MCFVGMTKIVAKIQKSIAYWMSMILCVFPIIGKLIVLALHKWVPLFWYFKEKYFKNLKYVEI
jgi:hypothetical protein